VQDEDGWTALHFAATKGHVELVELLLRSRADHAIKVRSILGDHPCPVLRPLDSQ
jgi:ankyrin repeat protein